MTWQPVPGYEGAYEAQQPDGVRSLDRVVIDCRGQARVLRGRTLSGSNYRPNRILLSRNGITTMYTVQEVMDMTFGALQITA